MVSTRSRRRNFGSPRFPIDPDRIRRILVIRRWLIGDVLVTTPAIHALRNAFPRARIAFLTGRTESEAVRGNPDIDEILTETPDALKRIKSSPAYDVVVNFEPATAYAEMCCLLSRARYRAGRWPQISPPPVRIYNISPDKYGFADNVVNDRFKVLEPMGVKRNGARTRIYLSPEEQRLAEARLAVFRRPGRLLAGIHPAGNIDEMRPRLWDRENFSGLADRLVAESGAFILIFHGPGEERIANEVYRGMRLKQRAFLVPRVDLRPYAAMVGACDLFVSQDHGPMHIAAARGVRTVGIFTSIEAPFWFPYEEKDGCVYVQKKNVSDVSVADVFNAVIKAIRPKPKRAARHYRTRTAEREHA